MKARSSQGRATLLPPHLATPAKCHNRIQLVLAKQKNSVSLMVSQRKCLSKTQERTECRDKMRCVESDSTAKSRCLMQSEQRALDCCPAACEPGPVFFAASYPWLIVHDPSPNRRLWDAATAAAVGASPTCSARPKPRPAHSQAWQCAMAWERLPAMFTCTYLKQRACGQTHRT